MATESSFPVADTNIDLRGPQFQTNKESWTPVLDRFEKALKKVSAEGIDVSLRRHQGRGQLLRKYTVYTRNVANVRVARDRVALLLDQDSPFLELGAFAGFENEESTPCANLIAGIGNVCGRICLLMSHIPTQSGGAWNEMTGVKRQNIYIRLVLIINSTESKPHDGDRIRERPSTDLVSSIGNQCPNLTLKPHCSDRKGRRFLATTVPSVPQRRPALPGPCITYSTWKALVCNCFRILNGRRSIPSSTVRLYHICREPGAGFPRRTSARQDGDW
jgi:hypothetical protein